MAGVLALWLASPCQAAIAYVNSATPITAGSGAAVAFGATSLTGGNALVVVIRWSSAVTVSSITDTALNTYTQVKTQNMGSDHSAMWYAQGVTGNASNVVTINFSAAATNVYAVNAQYSGLATSSALDATVSGSATGTTVTSPAFSTVQASEVIVIGFAAAGGSGTGFTPSGTSGTYTSRSIEGNNVAGVADFIASSTQSGATATWTWTTSDTIGILVGTFKAPGGGGGTPGCKNGLLLMGVGCEN